MEQAALNNDQIMLKMGAQCIKKKTDKINVTDFFKTAGKLRIGLNALEKKYGFKFIREGRFLIAYNCTLRIFFSTYLFHSFSYL